MKVTDKPVSAFAVYKKSLTKPTSNKKTKRKNKIQKHVIQHTKNGTSKQKRQKMNSKLVSQSCEIGTQSVGARVDKKKKHISVVDQNEKHAHAHIERTESTQKTTTKNCNGKSKQEFVDQFRVKSVKKVTFQKPESPYSDSQIEDPIKKGYQLFEWLIAPVTPKYFLSKHWETEHLHISRNKSRYYSHILTSRNLDQIFRDNSLYYTRNVDVVLYENEEKQVLNPEGKANPAALWDFYSNGCSIRLLNPQTYSKKVHLLVSTLQEYFGSMVGVNVYLTPPGSQGFAPHFDDIEAFVIQLEGRKHWKLYKPREEDVLARFSSKNFTHEEIGNPLFEVALEAGDLLYFPRGIIHEGKTDSEQHSLHLTISLYQNNAYVDLLEKILPKALAMASKADISFRKGLPLHFLKSDDAKKVLIQQVSRLVDRLKDHLDVNAGLGELGRKMVYDSMPPVLSVEENACSSRQDGDLLDNGIVYNKVEFDVDTKIRLTRYHCIQLVNDDDKPKLYYSTENATVFHGEEEQSLDLEPCMVDAIRTLQKSFPVFLKISCLPIEDTELNVQFVYDLWEKGIVITDQPLGTSNNENDDRSDSESE